MTMIVDADAVTMVLDSEEHTRERSRAAIDEIAERVEAEIERRGLTGYTVERDYRTTGRRGADLHEVWEAVLVGQVDAIRAVVLDSPEIRRAREIGSKDGRRDREWIDEGQGQDAETGEVIPYTAASLHATIATQASWNEAAINAGAWEISARAAGLDVEDRAARTAYYEAYATAAEQAAKAALAALEAREA